MTDPDDRPEGQSLTEFLAEQNARLEGELQGVREILRARSEGAETLKKIEEYLPQLTHLSTNVAHVGGALQRMEANQMAVNNSLVRIGNLLEKFVESQVTDDGDRKVVDRQIHLKRDAVWNGRICKKYEGDRHWRVFDPGPADPMSAGDVCTNDHGEGDD